MKKVFLLIALLVLGSVNVYAEDAPAAAEAEAAEAEAAEMSVSDMPVYDSETDEFFKNSAFVGDSIMLGYKNYCMSKDEGFMGSPLFLASGSFSLWQSVSPLSDDSLHPLYQGEKTLVENAVVKSGSDKIFICLGTNDLGWIAPETCVENYNNLIYRIHSKAPDAKIYIIGLTYMCEASQRENLNNENMRIFNEKMRAYTEAYDYTEFIDIGGSLADENGNLKEEYASDGYVHLTTEGYDVWTKVLRFNAKRIMSLETAPSDETAVS